MRRILGITAFVALVSTVLQAQPVKDAGGGVRLEVGKDAITTLTDSGKMISVRVVSEEKNLTIDDKGDFLLCGLPEGKEVSVEVEAGKGVKPSQIAGEWVQSVEWTRGSEKCRLLLDGRLKLTETKTGYALGPFSGKELAFAVKGGEPKSDVLYMHVEGGERMWGGKGPVQWEVYVLTCHDKDLQVRAVWETTAVHSAQQAGLASFDYTPVIVTDKGIEVRGRGCKAIRCLRPLGGSLSIQVGSAADGNDKTISVPEMTPVSVPTNSSANTKYFKLGEKPFYPIGKNVAWQKEPLKDYAKVFTDMRRAGENTCRIWSASWHIPLVTGDPKDGFDPVNAYIWDELFRMAYEEGVYIIPVLENAYDMTMNAGKNPLMKAAGAKTVEEFMISKEGRKVFKKCLDEAGGRFWAFPSLLMIEGMNEPDLALLGSTQSAQRPVKVKQVLSPWLNTLPASSTTRTSGYLAPFTMGLWDGGLLKGLKSCENLAEIHVFMPPEAEIKDLAEFSAADLVASQVRTALDATKGPVIVGEFGYRPPSGDANSPDAAANHTDKEGIALRDALWVSIASGASGPVLPWWWDTHIAKYGLDKRITAVSKFLGKVDLTPLCEKPIPVPAGMEVKMYGMRGRGGAFLVLLDPKASVQNRLVGKLSEIRKGLTLSLPGMNPGRYMVRFWDLDSGEVVSEYDQNASTDGWVFLTVPEFREGIAVTAIALAAGD